MKTKLLFFILMCFSLGMMAQTVDVEKMSKEEILQMDYDQLLELPFEDLLKLADIVGVSADELLKMVLDMQVYSASKKKENLFDSPLSTSVLTKVEIANSGATSIPELLRMVPGVIVREKTNGNYEVHLRGLDNVPPDNFSYLSDNMLTLVMIDDAPFYNYANGSTFWESLPITLLDIERIDVIRGPSSALYGPSAVSGVINIITKKQEKRKGVHAQADIKYGMLNTTQAIANVSSKLSKNFSVRVGGSYEYRDRTQKNMWSYPHGKYLAPEQIHALYSKEPYFSENKKYDFLPAVKKYNANANLYYKNKDLSVHAMGAYQNSYVQTVFMETYANSVTERLSKTFNTRLSANWKGLRFKFSHLNGMQDAGRVVWNPSVKWDFNIINTSLEYAYNLQDKITITPGFNFQHSSYDLDKYTAERKKIEPNNPRIGGVLKGKRSLRTYGGSMRLDYTPTDKLRFIVAARADKYNYPKKMYFSWQLVSSYKFNEKNILRLVYSHANRGALVADTYMDFRNYLLQAKSLPQYKTLIDSALLDPNIYTYEQHYKGNKELKLPTMDNVELGFRSKLHERLQIDVEAFFSYTKDFSTLLSKNLTFDLLKLPPNPYANAIPIIKEEVAFQNLDLTVQQLGLSYSLNYVPFNKLYLNLFGTIQRTDLKKHIPDGRKKDSLIDEQHKWTPLFYGGLSINYALTEKLNIHTNLSFATKQIFRRYLSPFGKVNPNEQNIDEIGVNALLNLTLKYKVWEENYVYISFRNITGEGREFGFGDPVKPIILGGIKLNF